LAFLDLFRGEKERDTRVRTSPLMSGDRIRIADVDIVYQR